MNFFEIEREYILNSKSIQYVNRFHHLLRKKCVYAANENEMLIYRIIQILCITFILNIYMT